MIGAHSLATDLISEVQSRNFSQHIEFLINGRDLSYKGFSLMDAHNAISDFSLTGLDASKNRVMLWLISSPGDFVREPWKGGPLEALLGTPLTQERASIIQKSIQLAFSEFFEGDLSLAYVTVTPDTNLRRWIVTLAIDDSIRKEFFTISVGVNT